MQHIVFGLFSFYIGIMSLLVASGKIPLGFKTDQEKEIWHKKSDKLLKVLGVLLLFCGTYQLISGCWDVWFANN